MSTVKVTIDIDVPPERLWETIMDPDQLKDWVTIHRSVASVTDRPLKQGSRMDQVLAMRGFPFHVNWTLVDVSAPRVAQWDGRGPAGSRAQIRYELSPKEGGRTHFSYTNEFSAPGGRLGSIASRVVVGAASEREANNSLNRLKALVEQH